MVVVGLLIAVQAGWLGPHSIDGRIEQPVHRAVLHHHWLLSVARDATDIGAPKTIDVLAAIVAIGLLVVRRLTAAGFVAASRVVTWLATNSIKAAVDRPRPHFSQAIDHFGGSSFPSGHSSGAASVYLPVAILALAWLGSRSARAAVIALTAIGLVSVAASRVLLGAHYTSDVVAGLALGGAVTWLCWATAQHASRGA